MARFDDSQNSKTTILPKKFTPSTWSLFNLNFIFGLKQQKLGSSRCTLWRTDYAIINGTVSNKEFWLATGCGQWWAIDYSFKIINQVQIKNALRLGWNWLSFFAQDDYVVDASKITFSTKLQETSWSLLVTKYARYELTNGWTFFRSERPTLMFKYALKKLIA